MSGCFPSTLGSVTLSEIWADPLKASLMGFAGFAYGDVEIDPSGELVIRTNMDNWSGTVGAASRDTPIKFGFSLVQLSTGLTRNRRCEK